MARKKAAPATGPTKKPERRASSIGSGRAIKRKNRGGKPAVREIASTRPVDKIKPRVSPPTRGLDPAHVVALAESIHALGLIEPIVIDADDHLLAGGHRLAACRVLAAPDGHRTAELLACMRELSIGAEPPETGPWTAALNAIPDGPGALTAVTVPVRVFAIRSSEDKETALAIEASENEQRRDYSKKEVLGLWERLGAAGFRTKEGRPKKGEKRALPLMATIIGKSERTIRLAIRDAKKEKRGRPAAFSQYDHDRKKLRETAQRMMKRHSGEMPGSLRDSIEIMLAHLDAK